MKRKILNSNSSYNKQVGGSHYLKYKIQPSKFVIENKLLFPEASVIKYIVRHQDKDGNKDLLKQLRKKYNLKLISKKKRKGFSKAVKDGIKKANADYLLMMDSDGQCDFKNILKLWKYRKEFDSINAYRIKRIDYAYRKLFSIVCFILYKILFNVPLKDPSFTLMIVSKKVYKSLNKYNVLCPDGFSWEFNARAKIKGFKFKEIKIIHKKRKYGETKIYTYT